MTKEQEDKMLAEVQAERTEFRGYQLPLLLGSVEVVALIGQLQLALRHEKNTGPAATISRRLAEHLVARLRKDGLVKHAAIAEMGWITEYDV